MKERPSFRALLMICIDLQIQFILFLSGLCMIIFLLSSCVFGLVYFFFS